MANDGEAVERHLRVALPQAIRGFYAAHAAGVRHWGNKNPPLRGSVQQGLSSNWSPICFQGSRFIHIIRDGRDVDEFSRSVREWEESKPWVSFEDAHGTWKRHPEN